MWIKTFHEWTFGRKEDMVIFYCIADGCGHEWKVDEYKVINEDQSMYQEKRKIYSGSILMIHVG
jgi:hypothetical protein